jgi:hypothetical protein
MNSYIETQNPQSQIPKSYQLETLEDDQYIPLQVETLLNVYKKINKLYYIVFK